jgi:hypothetical protein
VVVDEEHQMARRLGEEALALLGRRRADNRLDHAANL